MCAFAPPPAATAPKRTAMRNKPTILIIDDDPVNGKLIETVLEQRGFQTLTAESGPEGRKLAQSRKPDLILLDIIMPDENGFTTCAALKLDPGTARIPVIFLSSVNEEDEKVKGFTLGAVDYITKPFGPAELVARIRLHIRLARAYAASMQGLETAAEQLKDFRRFTPGHFNPSDRPGDAPRMGSPKGIPIPPAQNRITLGPGEYYASNQPVTIHTVLGSCIAACLWDQQNAVVGMNHFLLTDKPARSPLPPSETDGGKYGSDAMKLLIDAMVRLGARRENLQAKVFGGGSLVRPEQTEFVTVGQTNSRFIVEFLKGEGIPLVSSDLGGTSGRAIYFSSEDFSVYVRKIGKIRRSARSS